jgi:DNA-binding LytR/AlgR family response regulator
MKVVIFEDEPAAVGHLQALIKKLPFPVLVLAVLDTVRGAVQWLHSHKHPDLFVSDIQLADGRSFEIFDAVPLTTPVIFTTAYDEYMQRAFKLHSIDYLLKPIDETELKTAFEKYAALHQHYNRDFSERLKDLVRYAAAEKVSSYKSRFLVKSGNRLSAIAADNILLLEADDHIVWLYDKAGRKFILDDSLDELERVLNPQTFFRLNRRYIAPITSIERIENGLNGKLHIRLKAVNAADIFVSRERARDFKKWLDGMWPGPY